MWNDTHPGFGGFGNTASASKGGGGFMSPNLNESQSTERKSASDTKKTICPVTVAQILKVPHTEDNVTIGSTKMSLVTFCGMVMSVEEGNNKLHFKVDDMTGPSLMCQYWISSSNSSTGKAPDLRSVVVENLYVRVTGALRIAEDTRFVLAFNVKPISDFNEVTVHMLEVIHSNMALSVVAPEGASASGFNMNNESTVGGDAPFSAAAGNGLNTQQNMVFQAVFAIKTEDGASIDYLCRTLSSIPKPKIREILEFLNNEGHIYTTIDDDHFKATEA